jgi:hypothetical protein
MVGQVRRQIEKVEADSMVAYDNIWYYTMVKDSRE